MRGKNKQEKPKKEKRVKYDRHGRPKLSRKEKMKEIIALYDELFYTKLAQNTSKFCKDIELDKNEMIIDFLGTAQGENITYYYLINRLPKELAIDWKDRLRNECKKDVRITFIDYIRRHTIEWESPQMKSKLRILRENREETIDKDINAYNMHENIKDLSKQNWIEESLLYLAEADKERGRALLKSSILVIVKGVVGDEFDDSVKLIERYARQLDIGMNRVMFEIPDLLEYFSPFSHKFNKNVIDSIPTNVLTDEILARFNTYNQGTLGVSGVYFGTDIYSTFPVLKRVKKTEDAAENWLISAETGGGKSFFVKSLILQLLSLNYNGTIMDIEGFEYLPIAEFMKHGSKVEVINMGEGNGKYFDPMEIADEVGIEDIDREAKTLSSNFTISIFKVLLGKSYAKNDWLDTVINDAVSETYADNGVTSNRSTWHLSKGLSLFDVFEKLKSLKRFRDSEDYDVAVEQALALTGKYFEKDGTRASVFQNRVRISEIIDADLIICSFGMAGKSVQSVDEVQLALMQLSAAQLSHQRSIFSKSQGKYNFKLWEEFQRWGKFPDSEKTLGVALTGGRKLGDVNIIISNKLSELLSDDIFGIFDNITSFLVGAIGDEKVRQEFCERLTIPKMKKEMDLLATAKREDADEVSGAVSSPFEHAFLCGLDKNKYGIVKMLIPPNVAKSKLFFSGIEKKE